MRIYISICLMFLLLSCKHDHPQKMIPKTDKVKSTSIDGLRTDAVDTLISKPEVIDSFEQSKK